MTVCMPSTSGESQSLPPSTLLALLAHPRHTRGGKLLLNDKVSTNMLTNEAAGSITIPCCSSYLSSAQHTSNHVELLFVSRQDNLCKITIILLHICRTAVHCFLALAHHHSW